MSREFRHRASLGLNVVLAVTVVVLVLNRPKPQPPVAAISNVPVNKTPVITSQPKLPQYKDMTSTSDRRRWIVDQLRAAGISNNVLARFVESDIEANWNKPLDDCHGDPAKLTAVQLEYDISKEAEMRAALGEEGFRQWDQKNMLREAVMGSKMQLTASEADAIYDLKKKLQQRQWELREARQKGEIDDADITKELDKAYADFTQQMKTVMGDARYAEAMRPDDGGDSLKQDLAKVNANDSQFQDILKAQQQWNDAQAALDPSAADYLAKLKALNDARDQEYQRVLGADVFDTLQKQQDGGYAKMKKYETTWGLDDNKIDSTYAAIQYYTKTVQDYQAQASALQAQGQSVDWDVVNKNLQQFKDQTQQALQNSLGQDTFNKLQQNAVFPFSQQNQQLPHSPPAQ